MSAPADGPLRVAHVIKGLGRGGAEGLLPQLAREGRGRLQLSVAYFLPWKDAWVDELRRADVAVECLDARSSLGVLLKAPRLARWLRGVEADVVHAHLPISGVAARLASRRSGIPLVYTEHNLQQRYRGATRLLNRLTWSMQTHVVAVSDEVSRSIRARLSGDVKVSVVRNGIAIHPTMDAAGRAQARSELGVSASDLVVGTVAVFRSQKRLDHWVEVAQRVAARLPAARFLMVGDGPMRDAVERQVRGSGLGDRVLLPGLSDDVASALGAMDVFLTTSEFEGLPLAVLEAMAAGLPVVASAVGGVPEIVQDGECGVLFEFGAVENAADHVHDLLVDAGRRSRMATSARARVQAEFSVARMSLELESIYRRVVGARTE